MPQKGSPASEMRVLAQRLLATGAGGANSSLTRTTADLAGEKLRLQLTILVGKGGVRALLSRALALASAQIPSLRPVKVKPDGLLEGIEKVQDKLGPTEFFQARVVLLAHLLGLLVAFIGTNLTLRLVREAWPNFSPDDPGFSQGDKNEKAK